MFDVGGSVIFTRNLTEPPTLCYYNHMSTSIDRTLNLKLLLKNKSYFLLGPRQTGKSYLIREQLPDVKKYDLLMKDVFRKLSFNPTAIREELTPKDKIIVIDEIQKLPDLLDEVQYLIENKGIHFLLTGSSARKLSKKGINTLGGRARVQYFHPLTYWELKSQFKLEKMINWGLLPSVYISDDPKADLDSYISIYLQQEIANEGLVRNLSAFSRFIDVAATCHAEQIDYTSISNDAQIARTTIHDYFQVLKDTLVGHEVHIWGEAKKRKPIATSKFYFFDWGVAKNLMGYGKIQIKTPLFGKAFESFIFQELLAWASYNKFDAPKYWRTQDQKEVDFIINDEIAIEVKGKSVLTIKDLEGLIALKEEKKIKKYYLVFTGSESRNFEQAKGIEILPYQIFLEKLWTDNL